jgi:hypothetical protein
MASTSLNQGLSKKARKNSHMTNWGSLSPCSQQFRAGATILRARPEFIAIIAK